ncbi:hypothetical protein AAFF_G00288680 [Aldrovandia affinis]|uniref:MAP7 domain containing 3 n=1 Tax=Aldrovandia affinis TaxID=143900 RepID=A0AAD7SQW3_9TELE|nr:hypothetical protein AAFF_G00288680 [Aldrovandia affinis]
MAEGATSLKEMRTQMAAAAQAQAEERRSQVGSSPVPAASPVTAKPQGAARPVIDGAALKTDERLRVAKERREEQEKQQAARESQILERERKAKVQYERQMEERQRKLDEQRRKEEQRRAAVDEKRKQKQEEEKEHYEAVVRRTLERSQRMEQRQKRWSWGGGSADSGPSDAPSCPVAIVVSPCSPEDPKKTRADKRCTSTMNLKQQSDSLISKRLSSSSAALINSPDKSAKRRSSSLNRLPSSASQPAKDSLPRQAQVEQTGPALKRRSSSLTRMGGQSQPSSRLEQGTKDQSARRTLTSPLDSAVLSRLLTPTQASLARSKSAAALSAEGSDPQESHLCPRSASASPLHPRGPVRSRSIDRKGPPSSTTSDATQKVEKEKRFSSPGGKRPSSPCNLSGRRRSPSPNPAPSAANKRTPSPGPARQSPWNRAPSPSGTKQRPLPHSPPPNRPPSSPLVAPLSPETPPATTAPGNSKTKDDSSSKASAAGTTSAEEAAKILSENRRLAREQKERDDLLKVQREEEEKLRKEEEDRVAEVERVRRLEEEKRMAEERKIEEEEQERLAEVERVRLEQEEQEKQAELQKEREEAEARALEEAEKQREEREKIVQQNQQERMERKRRIEEIMKRTRKTDQNDLKRDEEQDLNGEMDSEQPKEEGFEVADGANQEEYDSEGRSQGSGQPMAEQEGPFGNMNGKMEVDGKEKEELEDDRKRPASLEGGELACSPTPESCVEEGSEFVNEDAPEELLPGLNGKAGTWSFEELIDLDVHSKSHALIDGDMLEHGRGPPDGPRVAFEEKGNGVTPLHPSPPIQALSEM